MTAGQENKTEKQTTHYKERDFSFHYLSLRSAPPRSDAMIARQHARMAPNLLTTHEPQKEGFQTQGLRKDQIFSLFNQSQENTLVVAAAVVLDKL